MRRTLVVGVLIVAAGLVAVAAPAAVGWVPATLVSSAVGLVAAFGVVAAVARRWFTSSDSPERLPPETVAVSPPGDELDRQLRVAGGGETPNANERKEVVRQRLHAAATQMLVREGYSESVAHDRLAAGTWTDDPIAAALFTDADKRNKSVRELVAETRTTAGRQSIRTLFGGGSAFERRANRVVTVLAERLDETAVVGGKDVSDHGRSETTEGVSDYEQPETAKVDGKRESGGEVSQS